MKIITHYYDDVKHDTINCVPLFPVLNLRCEFEAHLTTKSFRSRDQSVRSRCSSHSAAQSHVAYSVQWIYTCIKFHDSFSVENTAKRRYTCSTTCSDHIR